MTPPLRVVLVTPHLGRDGGVAAHVVDSAQALQAAGHAVILVGGEASERLHWEGQRVIHPSLLEEQLDKSQTERALAAVRDLSPDVVHTHNLSDSRFVAALRSVGPLVFSAHGYAACSPNTHYFAPGNECERAHGPGCVPHMLFRGCLHSKDPRPIARYYSSTSARVETMRAADAVVAYSNRIIRHLRQNQIPNERLVPLFVAPPRQDSPPHCSSVRRVLFVGRVVKAKGLDVLLRAMSFIDGDLEVCGEGWSLPRARSIAQRLGIEQRVAFSGWRSPDELETAYARAAVVALPSQWPEPFGLVGLEASTRGRPVVASDTGGVRDWLEDGETGLLVAPGDPLVLAQALNRLLDDPPLARAMGAKAADLVSKRFSAQRHRSALEAVYTDAIARWRGSVPVIGGTGGGDSRGASAEDAPPSR